MLTTMMPPHGTVWRPVTNGESGADVFRSADGSRFAKCVAAQDVEVLADERDRTEWLSGTDIPCPSVLDWQSSDAGACMVTSAVVGVAADAVSADTLALAWDSIADAVRNLHELSECPFDRDLTRMFALAEDVVARGAVNPEFLPEEQRATDPEVLLALLAPHVDVRLAQEAVDTVVCHGDLCLPNIFLDPTTFQVTGFIDLGRLGKADRYADLSLLLSNSRETWPGEERALLADNAFAHRYGLDLDAARQLFYLHLDPLTWG